jgi:hypothetical protein
MDILVHALVGVLALGTVSVTYVSTVPDAAIDAGQAVAGTELARMLTIDTLDDDPDTRWSRERLETFATSFDHVDLQLVEVGVAPTSDGAHGLEVGVIRDEDTVAGCVTAGPEGWPTYVDAPCDGGA